MVVGCRLHSGAPGNTFLEESVTIGVGAAFGGGVIDGEKSRGGKREKVQRISVSLPEAVYADLLNQRQQFQQLTEMLQTEGLPQEPVMPSKEMFDVTVKADSHEDKISNETSNDELWGDFWVSTLQ